MNPSLGPQGGFFSFNSLNVGGEITKRLVALAEQQLGGHKK